MFSEQGYRESILGLFNDKHSSGATKTNYQHSAKFDSSRPRSKTRATRTCARTFLVRSNLIGCKLHGPSMQRRPLGRSAL
jgi:hypothetical protein